MHPVGGLPYHAEAWLHLPIPSDPVCACVTLHGAGFGAVNGHLGFESFELTEDTTLDSHAHGHSLHHNYFGVNYGGDGLVPLDMLFGTWHDGSKKADARMNDRFRKKTERINRKAAAATPAE